MLTRWTRLACLLAALGLAACGPDLASSQPRPLVLERTIPLPGVTGRIDHLAVDVAGRRLFVAALGNGSVEAVSLDDGRVIGRITGLPEPQGIAFLPRRGELAVANGGDGSLRLFRASDLAPLGAIPLGADADNVRLDPESGRLVVGFGSGALAVVDPVTRRVVGKTQLPAHPEGFQLDGGRAYVNLPDAGQVGVADLAAGRLVANWPNAGRRWNYPLAFEPASRQVAVAYRLPAKLVIFDAATGSPEQALGTCGDSDDLFFDTRRGRLYVACGAGAIEVFTRKGRVFQRTARIGTVAGARTAYFAPALDRLYLAVRASAGQPAAIRVYRPE